MSDPSRVRFPWHRSAVRVLTTVVAAAAASVVVSAIVYLASGEVSRVDDAFFESMAGLTTTSLTVLDPETLPNWLLTWRALTQWLGGAGALMFALVVVPTFGGQRRLSEVAEGRGRKAVLASTWLHTSRRLVLAYVGFTAVVIVAYASAGMGMFDAATFGLTTASTGGFANYRNSFAHFDSAAIEWVGAWAMGLAGMSVAALVWIVRGQVQALWRSTEVKLYAGLILVPTVLVSAWTWQDTGGGADTIRQSFFTVTSAISTTGFRVTDWGHWVTAPQTLLLMLIGIGSMAGSAGGGFRVLRVIQLLASCGGNWSCAPSPGGGPGEGVGSGGLGSIAHSGPQLPDSVGAGRRGGSVWRRLAGRRPADRGVRGDISAGHHRARAGRAVGVRRCHRIGRPGPGGADGADVPRPAVGLPGGGGDRLGCG